MQMPIRQKKTISSDPGKGLGVNGDGTRELGAVVETVRVTSTVVVEDVKLTVEGLKLQLLCGGRLEHIEGDRAAEPVNPLWAVNVSVVDPDCPGLPTLSAIGLALIVNVAGGVTVSVSVAEVAE